MCIDIGIDVERNSDAHDSGNGAPKGSGPVPGLKVSEKSEDMDPRPGLNGARAM